MTIVTNNNINNVSLMLNPNQSGLMGGDGTVLTGNFLDIISMLSDTPNLNLTNISDAELLTDRPNNDTVFSTLQLLQKLFEENEINSKTNIAPELFSKFFEIVNDNKDTADKAKLDVFEIVPCALSDLESVPNEKILLNNAVAELKAGNFPISKSLESEVNLVNKNLEKEFSEGSKDNTYRMIRVSNIPTWPAIVDTSVLVDQNPNTVVIDLQNVLEALPNKTDEFQISKLFTRLTPRLDQSEKATTYQNQTIAEHDNISKSVSIKPGIGNNYEALDLLADEPDEQNEFREETYKPEKAIGSAVDLKEVNLKTKETNLNIKIKLTTNSVEVRGETENSLVIKQELPIPDGFVTQNNVIAVDIDKVMGQNLLFTVGSDQIDDVSNLPRKVILQFSEAKPVGSTPSIKVTSVEENELDSTKQFIDTTHATVIVKSNENLHDPNVKPAKILKVFNPDLLQLNHDKNSLEIIGIETSVVDFSEEISSRLKTFVSGEFSSKSMLNTLRETISKKVADNVLNETVKPHISDLLNLAQQKPKTKLLLSTADVLGYRETLNSVDKISSHTYLSSNIYDISKTAAQPAVVVEPPSSGERMLEQILDETRSKITLHDQPKQTNQPAYNVSAAAVKAQTTGASTFINTLNLYEAQFTSRVGMLLADQMARGNENFEFQLEPESFGKVRVNVALENSNVEIKMVVDNTAAVMALRGGENMLQVLAEQHGLKLSEYVVDLQNNQNGKSSDQDKNFQENEKDGLKNAEDFEQEIEITNPDSRYNLNLLA